MTEVMVTQVFNGYIVREVIGQQLKQAFIANDLNEVLEIITGLYKAPKEQESNTVPAEAMTAPGKFVGKARRAN